MNAEALAALGLEPDVIRADWRRTPLGLWRRAGLSSAPREWIEDCTPGELAAMLGVEPMNQPERAYRIRIQRALAELQSNIRGSRS